MDRLTRRELKQDQLRTTYEGFEEFAKTHYKDILGVVGVAVVVVGLAAALKFYMDRQEAEANAQLGAALKTFRAYVGNASPEVVGADSPSFPTAQEKYKKALQQFTEVVHKFPRQNAAAIARYHVGVLELAGGDAPGALAEADSIRRLAPTHLFGFMLRARALETQRNAAGANQAYRDFLKNEPAERARSRPEYAEHAQNLDSFHTQAVSATGRKRTSPD